MVFTHITAMFVYYLHTWKSCLFICLTYPCSLSCLAQLCALYKSKTNKLQVLVAAVGGWTHFGEIKSYHPTSNISHGCSVRVIRFITTTNISYLHRIRLALASITSKEAPFSSYIGSQKIQLEFKHHKGKKLLSMGCPFHQLYCGASLSSHGHGTFFSTHRFCVPPCAILYFVSSTLPTPALCFFSILLAAGLLTAANTGNNGPQSCG